MFTHSFMPPGADSLSPMHLRRLPGNAISTACRDPRFRRLVHWLGLAPCQGSMGAFTCRVSSHKGVFGLAFEEHSEQDGMTVATFGIHYFPAPEEELCDLIRLEAAVESQRPGYLDAVRDFATTPRLNEFFRMARLEVRASRTGDWLALHFEAEKRRRIMVPEGIGSHETGWAVEPGGLEEDLPAMQLARVLFDVVASSFSAACGEAPRFFARGSKAAVIRHRDASGVLHDHPVDDDAQIIADTLAWGATEAMPSAWLRDAGCPPSLELRGPSLVADMLPGECAHACYWYSHDLDSPECTAVQPTLNDKRPGLVVVSGFLGSGKTTFLNNCIEYHRARERFVAVIQNEVGATGVDSHLLGDSASVVALDEGCVCCTLSGSLAAGIRTLTAQFSPEVILLETTGLANPLNLLAELGTLRELVRLDTIVTVVDAANAGEVLRTSDIARDQIRGADIIVCNKCDTVEPGVTAALRDSLAALNRRAVLHETTFGRIHPALFMDIEGGKTFSGIMPTVPGTYASHAEEGFGSVRLFLSQPVPEQLLEDLLQRTPGAPFRIKGIVRAEGNGAPLVVQAVGSRCDVAPLEAEFDETPFLVFIGKALDPAALLNHWAAFDPTTEETGHVPA